MREEPLIMENGNAGGNDDDLPRTGPLGFKTVLQMYQHTHQVCEHFETYFSSKIDQKGAFLSTG